MTAARRFSFPHNDYDALDKLLAQHRDKYEEPSFSLKAITAWTGTIPDVPRIIESRIVIRPLLDVDEAHSMGLSAQKDWSYRLLLVFQGVRSTSTIRLHEPVFRDLRWLCCRAKTIDCNLEELRTWMLLYGAAPTPANTAAGLETLRIMRSEPERALRVQSNAAYFIEKAKAAGLNTYHSKDSGVVPS